MPNYDFQCSRDGIFEALSAPAGARGVASVNCPKCGELAPQVWLRAPSIRPQGIAGMVIGGRPVSMENLERKLDEKPPDEDAGFWDDPGFMSDFLDKRDQKTAQYLAGELPPIQLSESEMKTLREGVSKE